MVESNEDEHGCEGVAVSQTITLSIVNMTPFDMQLERTWTAGGSDLDSVVQTAIPNSSLPPGATTVAEAEGLVMAEANVFVRYKVDVPNASGDCVIELQAQRRFWNPSDGTLCGFFISRGQGIASTVFVETDSFDRYHGNAVTANVKKYIDP